MCALRGVAQPGSAPAWGVGRRWFKSSRPDQHRLTHLTCFYRLNRMNNDQKGFKSVKIICCLPIITVYLCRLSVG